MPNVSRTYKANTFWGEWGKVGIRLSGIGKITLLPGRLNKMDTISQQSGFFVTVDYDAKELDDLVVGTRDWRQKSQKAVELRPVVTCQKQGYHATYHLTTNVNQWSQLSEYYHRWHTRLLFKVAQITKDGLLYTTALRWHQYHQQYLSSDDLGREGFIESTFSGETDAEADRLIAETLIWADPKDLSSDELVRRLGGLEASPSGLDADRLLSRIGMGQSQLR